MKAGKALTSPVDGGVSESDVTECVALAFQQHVPTTNPLPSGTARVLAHVLTHDQVYGSQVERNFREAGWDGPPTSTDLPNVKAPRQGIG